MAYYQGADSAVGFSRIINYGPNQGGLWDSTFFNNLRWGEDVATALDYAARVVASSNGGDDEGYGSYVYQGSGSVKLVPPAWGN